MELRAARKTLGLSQNHLARLSGVSRFKICTFELGDGVLGPDDEDKILRALQAEAERLRNISALIDVGQLSPSVDRTRIRSGEYS